MKWRYGVFAITLIALSAFFTPIATADTTTMPSASAPVWPQPADVAAPKLGKDGQLEAHFKKLHEEFLKRRTAGPIDLLFLGDSITEGWHGRGKDVWAANYAKGNAANFGIGGDQTQHILWRIDNGELDGISPKVLVLLIGTNNIGTGATAENTLKGVTKVIQEIHDKLPDTKVLVMGIFPRGADPATPQTAEYRAKISEVNKGLAALDDGNKTRFLDIGDKFLTPDGKITNQYMFDTAALHPNAAGYQLWADGINPLLAEMMK